MSADRTKRVFQDALACDARARDAFLREACGDDHALLSEVNGLLASLGRAGGFLEAPATWLAGVDLGADAPIDAPGDRVGRFTLAEVIGSGGFGTVWRARQDGPVDREVAVKILKLGMDTAEVVTRFERERDALLRLRHPGISAVVDGGSTRDGRPWFAMDLVDGEPLAKVCTGRALPVRERLELFVGVCRAIQHAHNQGIVHRDVKPSNVLVTEHDGTRTPVVIDFGVAMAIDAPLAAATRMTGEHRLVGTPDYMSPEQIEGGDVDTRTDVYSLGVLLHELLTDRRPFGTGAVPEILRRVLAGEPPRPSACAPRERRRALAGELDWITGRAMARDPDARYATADALAADVERHLRDEPVDAGPPSAWYRLRKLARRHRAAWLGTVMVVVAVLVGGGLAVAGLLAERAQRERATLALATVEELLASGDPARMRGPDYSVRQMLEDFDSRLDARPVEDPEIEARIRAVVARTQRQLGEFERAEANARRAFELRRGVRGPADPSTRESAILLAWTLYDLGRFEDAYEVARGAVPDEQAGSDAAEAAGAALDVAASALVRAGRAGAALAVLDDALRATVRSRGPDHWDVARVLSRKPEVLMLLGRVDAADEALAEAIRILSMHVPADHPEMLTLRGNRAVLLENLGRWDEARALHESVLAARLAVHGSDHPNVAMSRLGLGWTLFHLARHADADRELGDAIAVLRASHGPEHLTVTEAMSRRGVVWSALGRHEEAEALMREVVERQRTLPGHRSDGLVNSLVQRAIVRDAAGHRDAARQDLLEALDVADREFDGPHPARVAAWSRLASIARAEGQVEEARRDLCAALDEATRQWGAEHPGVARLRAELDALAVTGR